MQAAILYGAHDFRIEDLPLPNLDGNECLLKVKACGVCHSEIHQWDVKIPGLEYPRHIGHEVSGEIIKLGAEVKEFLVGDRVATWVDCKGYADHLAVKKDRLFKMSDDLAFDLAILEPIACTTNGVMKADIQLGDTVALVGTGFMGLILMQQIKLVGASKIIAIDIRDEMLALAKTLGADITINPSKENIKEIINHSTNGKGVDVSFEIGGVQSTLDLAAEILRMEGKLVIIGYHPGQRIIKDLGFWNWMAFDIINGHFRKLETILNGSRIGMQLLNQKKINMQPLITHKFKLTEIENAFQLAKEKPAGFVKSVIVFD
jgi:threonine dehydrogenase-like Zn-dependent dehydrogenase